MSDAKQVFTDTRKQFLDFMAGTAKRPVQPGDAAGKAIYNHALIAAAQAIVASKNENGAKAIEAYAEYYGVVDKDTGVAQTFRDGKYVAVTSAVRPRMDVNGDGKFTQNETIAVAAADESRLALAVATVKAVEATAQKLRSDFARSEGYKPEPAEYGIKVEKLYGFRDANGLQYTPDKAARSLASFGLMQPLPTLPAETPVQETLFDKARQEIMTAGHWNGPELKHFREKNLGVIWKEIHVMPYEQQARYLADKHKETPAHVLGKGYGLALAIITRAHDMDKNPELAQPKLRNLTDAQNYIDGVNAMWDELNTKHPDKLAEAIAAQKAPKVAAPAPAATNPAAPAPSAPAPNAQAEPVDQAPQTVPGNPAPAAPAQPANPAPAPQSNSDRPPFSAEAQQHQFMLDLLAKQDAAAGKVAYFTGPRNSTVTEASQKDGLAWKDTQKAVKHFQETHGLTVTGKVDAQTKAALEVEVKKITAPTQTGQKGPANPEQVAASGATTTETDKLTLLVGAEDAKKIRAESDVAVTVPFKEKSFIRNALNGYGITLSDPQIDGLTVSSEGVVSGALIAKLEEALGLKSDSKADAQLLTAANTTKGREIVVAVIEADKKLQVAQADPGQTLSPTVAGVPSSVGLSGLY